MRNEKLLGTLYAVIAYMLWGILPMYWKLVNKVSPIQILAHRILWAFVFVLGIILFTSQWKELKSIISDKRQLLYTGMASVLITINWGVYIWAVNSDRIVDASLGYYINPLFAVLLGVLIFKERLNYWQGSALLAASIGVIILTVQYGKFPWVSLTLAISFGLYGAIKKLVKASSIIGLMLETAVITPIALIYIISKEISVQGIFGREPMSIILLLIGAGVVTAIPLILFAKGAKMISLSALGFTQYISPTISLFIGVFVYHENFTTIHMISFCFIWLGLAIYSIPQLGFFKSKKGISGNISNSKVEDAL